MKRVLCVLLCALLCALAGCALAQVTDGTYSVTVPSYSVTEQMTLEVTFEGGRITAIEAVTEGSTAPIFATVREKLFPRIIEHQSVAVDAIAGATVSSAAVRQAVGKAIELAGGDLNEWKTPVEKSTETVTLEGYDVVVVGLGASGIGA